MARKPSRFAFHVLITLLLAGTLGAKPVASGPFALGENNPKADDRLIAHEWGTFTSIAGKDGVAVEWRPLEDASDLPSFVYDTRGLPEGTGLRNGNQCVKCNYEALVRMETPVIYFYADRPTTVSVRVDFLGGKITEWYPQARAVYVPGPEYSSHPSTIDWGRITVMPGAKESFPVEAEPSHYYPARETDAAPIRVCGSKGAQMEKFLFYRGVGTFQLPLAAKLDGGKVVLKSATGEKLGPFVLFENREGRIGYQVVGSLEGEMVLDRPAASQTIGSLESNLEMILVTQGLYGKEARAMIKTWHDSWFEQGLRVFYIVPRKMTDAVLPISMDPKPTELVRVLVGRVEIVSPEMESEIRHQVASLADSATDVQSVAAEIRHKHGRFAEPVLKAVLEKTGEPELRARIQHLLSYTAAGSAGRR